jgi:hypothetical protein
MLGDCVAHDPAMQAKDVREVVTELLEQPRRSLDIAEEQREGSGRERQRATSVFLRLPSGAHACNCTDAVLQPGWGSVREGEHHDIGSCTVSAMAR